MRFLSPLRYMSVHCRKLGQTTSVHIFSKSLFPAYYIIPIARDTKNIMKSTTKSLYSLLWIVFGEWELGIPKPPVMFCGLNIPLIMLIFYMDINIRRNVGVLFCILASEHPVNPVVLVAVMSSAFIIQIYKSIFLPYTHIEVVRRENSYGSDLNRHCDFVLVLGEYGRSVFCSKGI